MVAPQEAGFFIHWPDRVDIPVPCLISGACSVGRCLIVLRWLPGWLMSAWCVSIGGIEPFCK